MKSSKYTYLRVTCTNCGATDKARNWYNQADQHRFIKQCYNCDPKHPTNKKKDKTNVKNVNLLSKAIQTEQYPMGIR